MTIKWLTGRYAGPTCRESAPPCPHHRGQSPQGPVPGDGDLSFGRGTSPCGDCPQPYRLAWTPRASLAVLLASLTLPACTPPPPDDRLQGYVEGEFIRIAAPATGTLQTLNVRRGDHVTLGAALFALESESEQAGKEEAHNRLKAAQANLDNLLSGKRRAELDVVQAQLAQAIAARDLSDAELKRQQKLFADGFISRDHMDAARTAFARDSARVDELKAQGQTARQSIGRLSEIKAAEGEVEAARAVLAQRAWGVAQKSLHAPSAGRVHDTYYSPGESVPAGSPIVSLLPADHLKIRFYVPEPRLANVRLGQEISVSCDGCKAPLSARVTYLSTQAEYTPPVIYSEQSRTKLVYLAEARPSAGAGLHVGQPVDVRLGK